MTARHKCGPIDFDFENDNKAMFIAPTLKNAASDSNTAFHTCDAYTYARMCVYKIFFYLTKNGRTTHKTVAGENLKKSQIFPLGNHME